MSDSKKKRLSMLNSLAAAGGPAPSPMMARNRPLRAARDAVDSHQVWELEPYQIEDTRVADRLDPSDVHDLRSSIEATGQTVPILVRRHATEPDKYLLVYGRRRLEAIRTSDQLTKVRALIAHLDDDTAVQAQITENIARRDLSFIEKALFAHELIENDFGNQSRVAEVLTVTKSAISMALAIVESIGTDLIRAIGPAHGVGRPRWETLSKALEFADKPKDDLVEMADRVRAMALVNPPNVTPDGIEDPSVAAFETVFAAVATKKAVKKPALGSNAAKKTLNVNGQKAGTLSKTPKGIRLDITQGDFADWIESQAADLINDLHARWQDAQKTNR